MVHDNFLHTILSRLRNLGFQQQIESHKDPNILISDNQKSITLFFTPELYNITDRSMNMRDRGLSFIRTMDIEERLLRVVNEFVIKILISQQKRQLRPKYCPHKRLKTRPMMKGNTKHWNINTRKL